MNAPSGILGGNLVDQLDEAVYVVDRGRKIRYWNPAAARLTGWSANEVIGRRCCDGVLCHVDSAGLSLCDSNCPLQAAMADGEAHEAQVFLHHKLGHQVAVELRTTPLRSGSGRIVGAVQLFHDGKRRREGQLRLDELRRLAQLDPLTGVSNRRHFDLVLASKLQGLVEQGTRFGLLMVDIDRFKSINDSCGHPAGDRVLRDVAQALALGVRVNDTVARIGGDEFAVLAPWLAETEIRQLADRLRHDVERLAVASGGEQVRPTVSLGGTLALESDSVESLVERADRALYAAKNAGRNCFRFDT